MYLIIQSSNPDKSEQNKNKGSFFEGWHPALPSLLSASFWWRQNLRMRPTRTGAPLPQSSASQWVPLRPPGTVGVPTPQPVLNEPVPEEAKLRKKQSTYSVNCNHKMKWCCRTEMFLIKENVFSRHTSTMDVRLSNCTCSWERAPWLKLISPVFLNNSLAFSSKLDNDTWWSSRSLSRARSLSNWDAFSLGPGWGGRGVRTSLPTASIQHLSWAALCRNEPHWETVHSKRLQGG